MSFSDLFKKSTEPHVDAPAQAKARADAVASVKAKADAKSAREAAASTAKPGVPPTGSSGKAARDPAAVAPARK